MPGRGPAPVPTALRVLRGARLPKGREPKPRTGRPSIPADVNAAERAAWRETVRALEVVPGLVTKADRGVLELVARTLPVWRDAMRAVREDGASVTVRDDKGAIRFMQQRPEMTIAIKLGAQLKTLYAELGLTPSGRTRIHMPEAPAEDELSVFLRKSGAAR